MYAKATSVEAGLAWSLQHSIKLHLLVHLVVLIAWCDSLQQLG